MKIQRVEFENFRNFKDRGEIICSTDGKVTIIYGKNGDGKTTLHQLFQWILYGTVHFNKTSSNKLYNLALENEQPYNSNFTVFGRMEFEHDNQLFSLTRTCTYRKGLNDSEKIAEDLSLVRRDEDNNWKKVDNASEIIEKLLPTGLSEYFFFDGESMIADLKLKEQDSASKLRSALYSVFDLDVIETAISHIGRTDLRTTVLGKLFANQGAIAGGEEIAAVKANIDNAERKRDNCTEAIEKCNQKKADMKQLINDISEQIGTAKSKAEYEYQRKQYKNQQQIFLENVSSNQALFGDAVIDMFPKLLISKASNDAKKKLNLQVSSNQLPNGLSKALINYLSNSSTKTCICGEPLCDKSRQHIREYLNLMPPYSYASVYNNFTRVLSSWGKEFNKESIEKYIKQVLQNKEQAELCDKKIQELDNQEKTSPDIENLIVTRKQTEEDLRTLERDISEYEINQKKYDLYLKKEMREYERLTAETAAGELARCKMKIMNTVRDYFVNKLQTASENYSKTLQENIQDLIDQMLTSKRRVSVTPEFSVRVFDTFNSEAKSEGQFAVVSFAYIGGILKMLHSTSELSNKEYPLVLDGPFSKLDEAQRRNVATTIPKFAPQVILFSKDDLQDVLNNEDIGRIWTLESNDERNVATVKEGYLWK